MKLLAAMLLFLIAALFQWLQPARLIFQGYEQYFPGQPRPDNCQDYYFGSYAPDFGCSINRHIWIMGSDHRITNTQFIFDDVRLGDVLDALGLPTKIRHYRKSWYLTWPHAYLYTRSLSPLFPIRWITLTE